MKRPDIELIKEEYKYLGVAKQLHFHIFDLLAYIEHLERNQAKMIKFIRGLSEESTAYCSLNHPGEAESLLSKLEADK